MAPNARGGPRPQPTGPDRSPAPATLTWLADVDAARLNTTERADCLRGLEQAKSAHTAARASVLAAFRA
jgi:hypothetical protein